MSFKYKIVCNLFFILLNICLQFMCFRPPNPSNQAHRQGVQWEVSHRVTTTLLEKRLCKSLSKGPIIISQHASPKQVVIQQYLGPDPTDVGQALSFGELYQYVPKMFMQNTILKSRPDRPVQLVKVGIGFMSDLIESVQSKPGD